MEKHQKLSKYLSLILRHKPEVIDITLDEHGWADVKDIIKGIAKTTYFDMKMLEEIVETDNKKRYSFNEDKTKIRANQGHSIPVDVGLLSWYPEAYLFHGSCERFENDIMREGLKPMERQYVHLSHSIYQALTVGKRHGTPIVFKIDVMAMIRDGYKFYISSNDVILTKNVPAKYLTKMQFGKEGE